MALAARGEDLELISGLGANEIAARLLSFHRLTEVGKRGVAFYLHELDVSGGYMLLGYASAIHFATRRLGLRKTSAYELLRAGKVLSECEILDRQFRSEGLSWSKVSLLCRVVTPETQAAWIERARPLTVHELDLEVRSAQRGELPRKDRKGLPAVRVRIFEEVDVTTKELWETAKRKFEEETGETASSGNLVRFLAHAFLKGELRGVQPGKSGGEGGKSRSTHQVVVHKCPECKKAEVFTEDGKVPENPEHVNKALPDAEEVQVRDDVPIDETPETDRPTPLSMQRMVLARDGQRCRSCQGKWELMAHHIKWRSHGGRTHPGNLITLCGRCHGLVHEGLLHVEGDPGGEVVFRNAEKQRLDGADPDS